MFNATLVPTASVAGSEEAIGLSASLSGSDAPPSMLAATEGERLRGELDRLRAQQQELMQLLGTTRPDRLVHDIRNLLQERMFLEAACKRYGI